MPFHFLHTNVDVGRPNSGAIVRATRSIRNKSEKSELVSMRQRLLGVFEYGVGEIREW